MAWFNKNNSRACFPFYTSFLTQFVMEPIDEESLRWLESALSANPNDGNFDTSPASTTISSSSPSPILSLGHPSAPAAASMLATPALMPVVNTAPCPSSLPLPSSTSPLSSLSSTLASQHTAVSTVPATFSSSPSLHSTSGAGMETTPYVVKSAVDQVREQANETWTQIHLQYRCMHNSGADDVCWRRCTTTTAAATTTTTARKPLATTATTARKPLATTATRALAATSTASATRRAVTATRTTTGAKH